MNGVSRGCVLPYGVESIRLTKDEDNALARLKVGFGCVGVLCPADEHLVIKLNIVCSGQGHSRILCLGDRAACFPIGEFAAVGVIILSNFYLLGRFEDGADSHIAIDDKGITGFIIQTGVVNCPMVKFINSRNCHSAGVRAGNIVNGIEEIPVRIIVRNLVEIGL